MAVSSFVRSQDIFDSSVLHSIHLQMPTGNWYDTLAVWYDEGAKSDESKKFMETNVTIDGNKLSEVAGIRFKGQYSYTGFPGKKKPFRLHFNKFNSQRYQGIRKINLHNLAGDPSFLREHLSYNFLRHIGVTASRTSFAKLYINNQYWGVYLIVEEPEDKLFLENHFGTSKGNLFDSKNTTRLQYLGEDEKLYSNELKLQTDYSVTAWKNLISFLDFYNNSIAPNYGSLCKEKLETETYFKTLSADVFLNNWDSYPFNGRNFFIYDNPKTNQLHWIPWDYNLSMWKEDLPVWPLDGNSSYQYKPLIWKIKSSTLLTQAYYKALCRLVNETSGTFPYEQLVNNAQKLIGSAVLEDTLKFYTYNQFVKNGDDTVIVSMLRSNIAKDITLPGIKTIFKTRAAKVREQLLKLGCDCGVEKNDVLQVRLYPNPAVDELKIAVQSADVKSISVTVSNTLGVNLFTRQLVLQTGVASLNISSLANGFYFLKIEDKSIPFLKQ